MAMKNPRTLNCPPLRSHPTYQLHLRKCLELFECLNQQAVISARNDARKKRTAQQRLQRLWADPLSVTAYSGTKVRWWSLAGGVSSKGTYGGSPPPDWLERPPAWDHSSIWVRDGKPIVAVSQPYPWLLKDEIERLNKFASTYGLRFKVSNYPSWHYPGRCWFIEWYGEDSIDPDLLPL